MHKVFISYHHRNDQRYKDDLVTLNVQHNIFLDRSVEIGDIPENLPNETIRQKIRDERLRDSTVTVLLVGRKTRYRKHVDWELKSSMINGAINKRSGILVFMLPETNCTSWHAAHPGEKDFVYPGYDGWCSLNTCSEYEERYPFMPERIIDNLINSDVKISVVRWNDVMNDVDKLRFLISATSQSRLTNEYDLSRKMRMKNYDPDEAVSSFQMKLG